nr:MAG TPA_asm: hypothetical protein [Caudoviricetes sp.]
MFKSKPNNLSCYLCLRMLAMRLSTIFSMEAWNKL